MYSEIRTKNIGNNFKQAKFIFALLKKLDEPLYQIYLMRRKQIPDTEKMISYYQMMKNTIAYLLETIDEFKSLTMTSEMIRDQAFNQAKDANIYRFIDNRYTKKKFKDQAIAFLKRFFKKNKTGYNAKATKAFGVNVIMLFIVEKINEFAIGLNTWAEEQIQLLENNIIPKDNRVEEIISTLDAINIGAEDLTATAEEINNEQVNNAEEEIEMLEDSIKYLGEDGVKNNRYNNTYNNEYKNYIKYLCGISG